MIIDCHVHLIDPPCTDERVTYKIADGTVLTFPVTRAHSSVECLLRDMDECGIDKAIVLATDLLSNETLSRIVEANPKRLVGFAWVSNPRDAEGSMGQLEKAVKEYGLRGLKLHPDFQCFSLADPELIPLIRKAAELGVPTLIHSVPGLIPGHYNHSLPGHFDALKRQVPEVTLIAAHMCYPRFLDMLTIAPQQRIYVDTSFSLPMVVDLFGIDFATRFICRIGVENVLFGSDWTGLIGGMRAQLSLIEKMGLTREEKEKILGENITKVLGPK